MKIAQISKADSFGGGASKVAGQLQKLLVSSNVYSKHYVSWSGHGYSENRRPLYGRHEISIRRAHYVLKKLGFPEFLPLELPNISRIISNENIDIAHFHDLSSAISPISLALLAKKHKIVWTLHDCSAFTGGCLYPMDCLNYHNGCGRCPQIGQWPIDSKYDFTKLGHKIRRYTHSTGLIELVAPSNWMADIAFDSGIVKKRPTVIPNGVDIKTFYPKAPKSPQLMQLKLHPGPKILISAGDLNDSRKGINFAIDAINNIKDLNPLVLLMGHANQEIESRLKSVDRFYTGYISSEDELADYYSISDMFLFCSLADNMPLAVLESMACGTSVIGFNTGGISDMVKNNLNGMLVEKKNMLHLIKVLKESISLGKLPLWGRNARLIVENDFSSEKFIERHLEFYRNILGG